MPGPPVNAVRCRRSYSNLGLGDTGQVDTIDWLIWACGLLIGGGLTWFFSWKYGNRRRKLMFTWEAVQLMPHKDAAVGPLEVTYEGVRVADPYLLKIVLKNIGAADIASSHFDQDEPLRVRFPEGFVAILDTDMGAATVIGIDSDHVSIPPLLLARGDAITIDALIDGHAVPTVVSKIVDTDIVTVDSKAIVLSALQETTTVASHFVRVPLVESMAVGALKLFAGRQEVRN